MLYVFAFIAKYNCSITECEAFLRYQSLKQVQIQRKPVQPERLAEFLWKLLASKRLPINKRMLINYGFY